MLILQPTATLAPVGEDRATADELAAVASRTAAVFDEIHQRVFLGDPAANPRLKVEVIDASMVEDTPTIVLVTPWTLNGLTFPPDGSLGEELVIAGRRVPVFANDLPELGHYLSVNLAPDVSGLASPKAARELAASLVGPFHQAVAAARRPQELANPSRRRLLRPAGE